MADALPLLPLDGAAGDCCTPSLGVVADGLGVGVAVGLAVGVEVEPLIELLPLVAPELVLVPELSLG